jgi:acyl carrier protein
MGSGSVTSSATAKEFQRDLVRFIQELAPGHPRTIRSTTRLFESGVVDSYKVLDLISYLETRLRIPIPDERVTLENFRSIRAMTDAFWKPTAAGR